MDIIVEYDGVDLVIMFYIDKGIEMYCMLLMCGFVLVVCMLCVGFVVVVELMFIIIGICYV